MSEQDAHWRARLPDLFVTQHVDYANTLITYTTDPVEQDLVSRLHLVATVADGRIVVCRSDQGWRFLPGGTREPGETLAELARRELLEEAGAELAGDITLFGAHRAEHQGERPYRPHLPFPHAAWAYAFAPVSLAGPPLNPPDGENVVEVLALPGDQAVAYLAEHDPIHADVLRHALALRA